MSRSGLSRADRLLWSIVLVGAALVALVTWLLLPPEKTGAMVEKPSTFFNVGYGTKAAYLVLDQLGYRVTRLRRPIARETLEKVGVLFILEPFPGLRDYEMAELESWVRAGHALVVVPGASYLDDRTEPSPKPSERSDDSRLPKSPSLRKSSPREPSERSERAEIRRLLGSSFEDWFSVERPAGRSRTPGPFPRAIQRPHAVASDVKIEAGNPIGAGIRQLATGSEARFARSPLKGPLASARVEAFWKDQRGTFGLRVGLGDGTIVALAGAYPLTNFGISEADNAILFDNLVRELSQLSPGDIAFDEYHLGFPQRDSSPIAMAKLALGGPWRWAMAQAALVGILALYAGAVRFGSPRDVTRAPRRQHREFAEAAGRLLDEAGAASLAAETLFRHYRARLCRTLHLEPEVDDARLSEAVRSRAGQDIGPVLDQARGAASRRIGRQELLTIAQKLHRVAEELDHGS